MRETRAAPVAYAPAGRLRKSSNVVDVPQRAEDFVDPLGLGYVGTVLRLYEFHSVLIFHVNIENLSPQTSLCGLKTHLTNCQIVFSIERTHKV